jgi:hypothetical protein
MTDETHTPGPWVRDNNGGYSINRIFSDARGHHAIAEVIGDDAETEANGDLIAAAPALYAALESCEWGALIGGRPACPQCSAYIEEGHSEGCDIRAALSQARGEA